MLKRLGRTKQSQSGGDNSVNIQANSVQVSGPSYLELREMMIDVFKANFPELLQEAREMVKTRVEAFVDGYLGALAENAPEEFGKLNDPDMQYALLTAQTEYARSGDEDLGELLIELLVDRTTKSNQDLQRIVLNESIATAPKLVPEQLSILSTCFMLRYSAYYGVGSIEQFREYLSTYIVPFMDGLSKRDSLYQHLEYAGCATISVLEYSLESALRSNYLGLFQKGLTQEEAGLSDEERQSLWGSLLMPCLHDSSKIQVKAINDTHLNQVLEHYKVDAPLQDRIRNLFSQSAWDDGEVKDFVAGLDSRFEELFTLWGESQLKRLTLTSVGIAIAQANARRQLGVAFDLSNWI